MKKMLFVPVIMLLAACSQEVKSIDYYYENEAERKSVLKECETRQGSHQDTNCLNAKEADLKYRFGKMIGK